MSLLWMITIVLAIILLAYSSNKKNLYKGDRTQAQGSQSYAGTDGMWGFKGSFLPSDLVKPPSRNFFWESSPWWTRFMDKDERHCIIHATGNWKGLQCSATRKWPEQITMARWCILIVFCTKCENEVKTQDAQHSLLPVLIFIYLWRQSIQPKKRNGKEMLWHLALKTSQVVQIISLIPCFPENKT